MSDQKKRLLDKVKAKALKPKADPPPVIPEPESPVGALWHKCGHDIPLVQLRGMNCPPCRHKAKREKKEAQRAKYAAKKAAEEQKGRLPPASVKHLEWDGERWTGTLSIPGCPPFHFAASGEKACFHGLDDLYRAWLKENAVAPSGENG